MYNVNVCMTYVHLSTCPHVPNPDALSTVHELERFTVQCTVQVTVDVQHRLAWFSSIGWARDAPITGRQRRIGAAGRQCQRHRPASRGR